MSSWSEPEQTVEQSIQLPIISDVLKLMWCQCNVKAVIKSSGFAVGRKVEKLIKKAK